MEDKDAAYMQIALEEARAAGAMGEVPIGAVVVYEPIDPATRRPLAEPRVIARARNRRETDRNPAGHAEFAAMLAASRALDAWRLSGCTVYVTLEPCPMCAGAIVQARPGRIVFGATDERMGAVGGALSLFELPGVNHRPWVRRGVMAQEAKTLLADFFAARRGAKENEREGEGEVR